MGMSMYVYRIRKKFLYSLGITEEQIEEFGGVLNSQEDVDGIPYEITIDAEREELEEFRKEGWLLNKLESYKDISKILVKNKYDYVIRIFSLGDLKRLLQDVKSKNIKLHYETKEEFNQDTISEERQSIIESLEAIIEAPHADKYYYTTGWY